MGILQKMSSPIFDVLQMNDIQVYHMWCKDYFSCSRHSLWSMESGNIDIEPSPLDRQRDRYIQSSNYSCVCISMPRITFIVPDNLEHGGRRRPERLNPTFGIYQIMATATGVRKSAQSFCGLALSILLRYSRLKSLSLMSLHHHRIPRELCRVNRCCLPEQVELPFSRVPLPSRSALRKVLNYSSVGFNIHLLGVPCFRGVTLLPVRILVLAISLPALEGSVRICNYLYLCTTRRSHS